MDKFAISFNDILNAEQRLKGFAHHTPVFTSRTANAMTGAELFFKCENYQRIGAFKFRGAYNMLSQFTPEERKRGVIAFSSGNHAQAVALCGQLLGIQTVIVMPQDSPQLKINATRNYGAEVILYDRYTVDREALSSELASKRNLILVPAYDHPDIIAGQGTAAKELLDEVGTLDIISAPVGGGGLLSGTAIAAKHLCPNISIYGVEPEAGNDAQQSFQQGHIVNIPVPRTIADGAQSQHLGELTFPIIHALADDMLTVTDEELTSQMRFFAERMKIVVEPTGCLAAAAMLCSKINLKGKRVGVIISGGNVSAERYAELLLSSKS